MEQTTRQVIAERLYGHYLQIEDFQQKSYLDIADLVYKKTGYAISMERISELAEQFNRKQRTITPSENNMRMQSTCTKCGYDLQEDRNNIMLSSRWQDETKCPYCGEQLLNDY